MNLPEIDIVFPNKDIFIGSEIKLLDPQTGKNTSFDNSNDIEIIMFDDKHIKIGLTDVVFEEEQQRLLSKGNPLIVKVTQLYNIASVKKED